MKKPNVVFVFSDQHRAEALRYAGNPDVLTPHLDLLEKKAINFTTAISNIPCCSPYRASLLTGQYPLTHGVFVNDVHLSHVAVSIADAFHEAGYDTAYIGKWHVNGRGRSEFIPREDRQGFDYWRVLECTHNYNHSHYYADENVKLKWDGYDAESQTRCAQEYIKERKTFTKPFFLVLSWGPPHNPYETAPQTFKDLYDPQKLTIRPNVPPEDEEKARRDLAGYYAHITALDTCIGELITTISEEGLDDDTIFVYTSDHGDMLGSHGQQNKQRPWDESIRVPFLLKYPRQFGNEGRTVSMPFNSPDIMPTLLGLCHISIPHTVEGTDFAPYLRGEQSLQIEAALIQSIYPFGQYTRAVGGKEFRGIRTIRYTYVKDLAGPWLLYDNEQDPFQMHNLCNQIEFEQLQQQLDEMLTGILNQQKDEFLTGEHYIEKWGYTINANGTVPYTI